MTLKVLPERVSLTVLVELVCAERFGGPHIVSFGLIEGYLAGGLGGEAAAVVAQERAALRNIHALLDALEQRQRAAAAVAETHQVPPHPRSSARV